MRTFLWNCRTVVRVCHPPLKHLFEFLSYIAIIAAGVVAYIELQNHKADAAHAEDREMEEKFDKIYRYVDERFVDFLKAATPYPRLDCYSKPLEFKVDLSPEEKVQQKLLYTMLTDVFEVAYVEYNKNRFITAKKMKEFKDRQWPGWDEYYTKFLSRQAYVETWKEIRNEYDSDFAKHMDGLLKELEAGKKKS